MRRRKRLPSASVGLTHATLLSSTILAAGFLILSDGQSAQASCSTSSGTETCEGDPGTISIVDGSSITTVVIQNLTADIEGDTAVSIVDAGDDDGDAGSDLQVQGTFDDGYGIDGTNIGIEVSTFGAAGEKGKDKTDDVDSAHADNGKAGGAGGTATVTMSGSTALQSSGVGITAESVGGAGGNGGKGSSDVFNAHGGDGATGGAGSTVEVDSSTDVQATDIGISLLSQGGVGGDGGEGSTDATAYGGDGGTGGAGGDVTITFSGSASISVDDDSTYGIFVSSQGGEGGGGGEGKVDDDANASHSGDGGSGGGRWNRYSNSDQRHQHHYDDRNQRPRGSCPKLGRRRS